MSEKLESGFKEWCIVELFGHTKTAGLVTEQTLGGCSFVRVDVPQVDGSVGFSKLYGNGAIYSIQPVSEKLVRTYLERYPIAPMTIYMPEIKKLPEPASYHEGDYDQGPDMEEMSDERG